MKPVAASLSRQTFSLFWADVKALTKVRLALSVVFSSLAGYLLGAERVVLGELLLLGIGGYAMVGASNAFNQVIERDLDALMKRTRNRPIPAGRVSVSGAMVLAIALTVVGLVCLYQLNARTALFGALSIFLYTSVYTPLKTMTPLAVFVGAIPGAIPFMLGWVAVTGEFGIEPGTLFALQFFWQFPHFWALGWMLDEDYARGGFKMLPTGKKDSGTALQIILYTLWTLAISILPVFGFTGKLTLSVTGAAVTLALGIWMLTRALELYVRRDDRSARRLMLASVGYITLVQVVYVIDKFI